MLNCCLTPKKLQSSEVELGKMRRNSEGMMVSVIIVAALCSLPVNIVCRCHLLPVTRHLSVNVHLQDN